MVTTIKQEVDLVALPPGYGDVQRPPNRACTSAPVALGAGHVAVGRRGGSAGEEYQIGGITTANNTIIAITQ